MLEILIPNQSISFREADLLSVAFCPCPLRSVRVWGASGSSSARPNKALTQFVGWLSGFLCFWFPAFLTCTQPARHNTLTRTTPD